MKKDDWVVCKNGFIYKVTEAWSGGMLKLTSQEDEDEPVVCLQEAFLRPASTRDFDKAILKQQARLINIEILISSLEKGQKGTL